MNGKRVCFIFGAGDYFGMCFKPEANSEDYVIAADGGYKYAIDEHIEPDLIMGDFDSLGFVPSTANVVKHPTMKDDTDMMLAVKYGLEKGYKNFVIYGGLGGRIDHSISNIQALSFIAEHGGIGYLVGNKNTITLIMDNICFTDKYRGYISVFAHGDNVTGLKLKGLKYELDDAVITSSVPVGTSNEFIQTKADISLKSGKAIVIYDDSQNDGLPKLI